jgi:hypothetical protein
MNISAVTQQKKQGRQKDETGGTQDQSDMAISLINIMQTQEQVHEERMNRNDYQGCRREEESHEE